MLVHTRCGGDALRCLHHQCAHNRRQNRITPPYTIVGYIFVTRKQGVAWV